MTGTDVRAGSCRYLLNQQTLIRNLLESNGRLKRKIVITILVCVTSLLNIRAYVNNTNYIWEVTYKENNQLLADYITEKYPDAVYASSTAVRGYMNLLFGRGIYEGCDINIAASIANAKAKENIVFLAPDGYDLQEISVYSVDLNHEVIYNIQNGAVTENVIK